MSVPLRKPTVPVIALGSNPDFDPDFDFDFDFDADRDTDTVIHPSVRTV